MNDIVHILNGDALLHSFPSQLEGEIVIFREMMMEGPVNANSFTRFMQIRKEYMKEAYQIEESEYELKSIRELQKIINLDQTKKVFLWFEYDLFCQINMWCTIYMLTKWNTIKHLYIIYPDHYGWHGFGSMETSQLAEQFTKALPLDKQDISFIQNLWITYSNEDWETMKTKATYSSKAFPQQQKIIHTHLERLPTNGQPGVLNSTLTSLINQYGKDNFGAIFRSFSQSMGRYGMGDLQVKRMVDLL